jgi:hypothetical protein
LVADQFPARRQFCPDDAALELAAVLPLYCPFSAQSIGQS